MSVDFLKSEDIPDDVKYIIHELEDHGFEAFIVGGCVRDKLMGLNPKDWDIATSARPEHMKSIFKKTYDTGIKHGTVTIRVKKECYEVTTYRIDGIYEDMRHPKEVKFTENIVEDLRRRDFTMNAVAFNMERGFVDPFGGIRDMESKVIRAVMEPDDRFREDALRMFRAVRFSSQLNFKIETSTWDALTKNVHLIKSISIERIRDEVVKTLLSDYVYNIPLLWKSGLMDQILPKNISDGLFNNLNLNAIMASEKNVVLRLSLLLKDFRDEAAGILKGLRFDNKTIKETNVLISVIEHDIIPDAYIIRKYMSETGSEAFFNILKLKRYLDQDIAEIENIAKQIIIDENCISLKDMKINGDMLKVLGINNGKVIGSTLKNLFNMVLREPSLNEYEILKSIIEERSAANIK